MKGVKKMDKERLYKIKNRVTEDIDYEDGEWLIEQIENQQKEIEKLKVEKSEIKRLYLNAAKRLSDLFQKIHDEK